MEHILEVKDLSFAYQGKPVLKDVSFSIDKGDFLGVIGPNGSGKSTLIKCMLKILVPDKGEIRILGQDIRKFDGWSKIGYVSQKANSFNGDFPATVREIVGLNLIARSGIFGKRPKDYGDRIDDALIKVGMQEYGDKLIGRLSGGQQQRVFIARVLVSDPEILFLDEPTVGIDANSEEALYCLLARLVEELGITVVMVTHDIGAITVHANKLVCLGEDGFVVHDIHEPLTEEKLSKLYGYGVRLHGHRCHGCERNQGGAPC
ncbi:MAG: metal ABC transporter ATP-binding protein [Clostridiaceae bacterium]|jgi:zinc transport system ATP-binding protein|nr:metal ABC transporter ATP-binding protein [Clostridiaceae bacterium]